MKSLVRFLFIIAFSTTISAQDQEALLDIQVDVVYLASDLLMGRETGTPGEEMAAQYIASRFEEVGLIPKGNEGSWFYNFDFDFVPDPHKPDEKVARKGKNVIGYIDNGAATTVVIGGHYDHLGMGGHGSRHTGEPMIHNGADDNASGVAALIYIADFLKKSTINNNNYLFIAFSGEELGLYGSKNYVNAPTIALENVNYMLNMDMVGRLNEEKVLAVNGVGTSPSWNETLEKINVADIKIKTTESGIGPSDHTSFYTNGIPVLHFFSGQHNDYHKPEDDSHLVNFQGIYEISEYIIAVINNLDSAGKLVFTKTKDESQTRTAAKFKVTLGVMPDYVYDGFGMRIDGVLDGQPAQKGGIEDGDIVIKIGDTEVKDIYGYMEGLSKFKAGDTTTVILMRGDEKIQKEVTF
jgi:hypothetical protein